jgi:hypothetical protein
MRVLFFEENHQDGISISSYYDGTGCCLGIDINLSFDFGTCMEIREMESIQKGMHVDIESCLYKIDVFEFISYSNNGVYLDDFVVAIVSKIMTRRNIDTYASVSFENKYRSFERKRKIKTILE